MGTGKSSLTSKLMGIKLMHNDCQDEIEEQGCRVRSSHGELIRVDQNDLKDHFPVNDSKKSVTKETSFVLSRLMGNSTRRQVMLIDSPGFFDPEETASDELRQKMGIGGRKRMVDDLTEKLKALGSVDSVLLMMKLEGGRVPLNLITAMKALEEMFSNSGDTFVANLGLVFSKCDDARIRDYRKKLKNKDKEYKELITSFQEFGVDISSDSSSQLFFLTSVDETLETIGREDEFGRLFGFFEKCSPLSTQDIQNPTELLQGKTQVFKNAIVIWSFC